MKHLSGIKKAYLATLLVCLLMVGCASGENRSQDTQSFMREKSIALLCKIDQLAECEDYRDLYMSGGGMSENGIVEQAIKVGQESYEKPNEIYYITVPRTFDFLKIFDPSSQMDTFPEVVQGQVRRRAMRGLGTMVANYGGIAEVALTSLLSMEESYIKPEGMSTDEDAIVVLTYDKYMGIVIFMNDKETVNIEGTIVSVESLDRAMGQDMKKTMYEKTGKDNIIEAICQEVGLQCKRDTEIEK